MKHTYNMDNFGKLEARALSFGTISVAMFILKTFLRLPKVNLFNICLASPSPFPPTVSPFTSHKRFSAVSQSNPQSSRPFPEVHASALFQTLTGLRRASRQRGEWVHSGFDSWIQSMFYLILIINHGSAATVKLI